MSGAESTPPGPSHIAVSVPNAPPDPDPLVREIAHALYAIECNYAREGSGPGSRFEGEMLETVQARWVIRRVRDHDRQRAEREAPDG